MAQVDLKIRTVADLQGVQQLKKSLQEIQTLMKDPDNMMVGKFSAEEIHKTISAVNALDKALDSAFDVNLNSINIEKFNQSLKKSNVSTQSLFNELSKLGTVGYGAFFDMTRATLSMGQSIQKTNKFVQEMKDTFSKTVRWGISSSIWNNMLSAMQQAYGYVKNLDKDLNDIRIVTGKSADQMERFAKQANRAAKDLAVSTRDYTQGALIYYQQGLSDEEVAARTNVTAKAANVTGQDMATVSEQLTAVWNGYQVVNEAATKGMQVYEEYVDKLAAVGAATASDLEEQATAMSKVASAASSMGVEFDQLNAQISTIVSVTRQAPESVGNALKTIYARLGDLQVDGVDEFGTSLGDVSNKLKVMGIEVVDSNGQMRDMGDVMTEVAGKWDIWTDAQKQAAAVAMAGKRQYNNLIALFDNWDMYGESLKTSMEAAGTLSKQQEISLDSLESKMEKLSTTAEKFYDALFDEKSLGGMIDALTGIVDMIGSLTQGLGGLKTILPIVGGILLKTFRNDIGKGIADGVINLKTKNLEQMNDADKQKKADEYKALIAQDPTSQVAIKESQRLVTIYEQLYKYKHLMSEEELAHVDKIMALQVEAAEKRVAAEERVQKLQQDSEKYNKSVNAEMNVVEQQITQLKQQKQNAAEEYDKVMQEVYEKEGYGMDSMGQFNISQTEEKAVQAYNAIVQPLDESIQILSQKLETLRDNLVMDIGKEDGLRQKEIAETAAGIETVPNMIKYHPNKIAAESVAESIIPANENLDEPDYTPEQREQLQAYIQDFDLIIKKGQKSGQTIQEIRKEIEKYIVRTSDSAEEAQKIIDNLEWETIEENLENIEKVADKTWEKIYEGSDYLKTLGNEDSKYVKKLEVAFKNNVKAGMGAAEAWKKATDAVAAEGDEMSAVAQEIDSVTASEENLVQTTHELEEGMSLREAFATISDAAGGVITTIGGLKGVFNSFMTMTDTSLTSTERFEAAFTGLAASIPMVIQGYTQMTTSLRALTGAEQGETLALAAKNAIQKLNGKTEQWLTSTKLGRILMTKLGIGVTQTETTTEGAESAATLGQAAANITLLSTMPPLLAITLIIIAAIIVLVAIIVAITSAINNYTKKLEKNADLAEKNLEKQEALTGAIREEKTAIDEVVTSYQDLMKQHEDGQISLEELRNKTYDLCKQYDLEDLAVQALVADYKELYGLMAKAQHKTNVKLEQSLNKEIKDRTTYIRAELGTQAAKSKVIDDGGKTLDVSRTNQDDSELSQILAEYGVKTNNGHINTEEFLTAASYHYEDMIRELIELGTKEANNLLTILTENKDAIQANTEAIKESLDLKYKNMFYTTYNASKDTIGSATQYQNVRNDLIQQLIQQEQSVAEGEGLFTLTGNTEKEKQQSLQQQAENYVDKYLGQFTKSGNAQKNFMKITAVQKAVGSTEGRYSTEQLEQFFNTLSTAEETFVLDNLDLASSYESLEDFIETFKQSIEYLNAQNFSVTVKAILDDSEISEEEIEQLFADNPEFATNTGLTEQDFASLDYGEKLHALENFYMQKIALSNQTTATEIKNIEKEQQAYLDANQEKYEANQQSVQALQTLQGLFDEETLSFFMRNDPVEFLKESQAARMNLTDFEAFIADMASRETGFLVGPELEEAEYVKILQSQEDALRQSGLTPAEASKLFTLAKQVTDTTYQEIDEYEATINSFAQFLEQASEYNFDYVESMNALSQATEYHNKQIDNLQSTYQDLLDITEEYNTHGGLTFDSLQSLANMSPEQLAALEYDEANNKLVINNELLKQNVINKLQQQKVDIASAGAARLLALAEEDAAVATLKTQLAFLLTGQTAEAAAQQAAETLALWDQVSADLSTNSSMAAQEIIQQTNDMMSMSDKMIEQVENGTISMSEMLTGYNDSLQDELKVLEEEIDRYWEINHVIGEIEEAMEDLERVQERLHGPELIKSLENENELLKKQKKAYEDLAEAQQLEANEIYQKLSGLGVDFFANGEIANYEEAMTNAVNRYNAAMSDTSLTDASREAIQKQYEEFVDLIEHYDDLTTKELLDTQNKIEEIKLEIINNNFEAWENEVEFALDTQQLERDWADFNKDLTMKVGVEYTDTESAMNTAYAKYQTYEGENGTTQTNLNAVNDITREIDIMEAGGTSNMYANISEAREALKDWFERAQDAALEQKETYQEMWDAYLEGIDQASEKLADITAEHERIAERLEYEQQLVELIYGEEAYDKMHNLYQAQATNTLGQIENTKQQLDMWTELYNQTSEGDADRVKYYELMTEAQSSLNDLTTGYVELLQNQYANTINSILKNFETTITNGRTFDDLSEEWDRMKEKSDKYFDSVESLYEIQSFANTVKGSIDSQTDIKNQQKLQALYDRELEYLREKENLTQYDLDAAEARYQIALKEIALEDAQNAKDSMKLTRGADGNWSYQYVADEDDVLAKQQELSDAYNNLRQLAKSGYEENLESAIQLQTDFQTKANEIAMKYINDEGMKNQKMKELNEWYYSEMELLQQENALYRNDLESASSLLLLNLREQDYNNYVNMTDDEKKLTDELKEHNIEDYQGLQTAVETVYDDIHTHAGIVMGETSGLWDSTAQGIMDLWSRGKENVKGVVTSATKEMQDAWTLYNSEVHKGLETAGTDAENLGKDYSDVATQVDELKNKTKNLVDETTKDLEGYQTTIAGVGQQWDTVSEKIQTALQNAKAYFQKIGEYSEQSGDFSDNGDVVPGSDDDWNQGDSFSGDGGQREFKSTDISFKAASNGPQVLSRIISENDKTNYAIDGTQGQYTIQQADSSTTFYISDEDYEKLKSFGFTSNFGKGSHTAYSSNTVLSYIQKQGYTQVQYLGSSGYLFTLTNGENIVYPYDDHGKLLTSFQQHANSSSKNNAGVNNSNISDPFLTHMATGGYTGTWGEEGKLAVLHEKELVLNKADTENILNTVSMVRSLEQGLLSKIAGMLAGLSNLGSGGYIPSIASAGDSSNVFNITAEFPNANDVTSIREAILSLPNIASQYIAENKK